MEDKQPLIITLARLHDSIGSYLDYIREGDIKKIAKNSAKIDKYFENNDLKWLAENVLDIVDNKEWFDFEES